MIDEQKLLDWLTKRKNDSLGSDRFVYRELLSRIENGEFARQFSTAEEVDIMPRAHLPTSRSWKDDDDQW